MEKIVEKLRQGKQWLISFVMVRTFLLSSRKRQNYLIEKNACMFLGLQNLAKKYDNDGDLILEIPETSQRIICKAGKQGYFPILAYNRLKLIVQHKGTGKKKIPIYLMNFIISQGSW